MLLDASIPARHPAAVAGFIAELWGGEALPLPPVPGRFVALAADGTGAGLEVLPAGLDRMRTARDTLAGPVPDIAAATTRLAIGTALDEAEVHLAAGMRGWQSRRALRSAHGHAWGVIEVWIEERLLVEVLTPAMQAEFRAARAEAAPGEAAPGRVLMVAT
ncbi:hypothetical protein [Elioraea sp.]|uniref:hypothetical protein n=1 Tax=Elioraea sp. TaxID=2185103 RepID=UPI00307D8D2C